MVTWVCLNLFWSGADMLGKGMEGRRLGHRKLAGIFRRAGFSGRAD